MAVYSQWRAAAADYPDREAGQERPSIEHGIAHHSRRLAERELNDMLHTAKPSYDEGWIEHREVTDWERVEG